MKKGPIKFISFSDLESIGFKFTVESVSKVADFEDVLSYKLTKVTYKNRVVDTSTMDKVLNYLGVASNTWWVAEPVAHYPSGKSKHVINHRFAGFERIDTKWIGSGYASLEALASSGKMKDLGSVMGRLQRGGDV